MWMMRWACCAMSFSWVTRSTVLPGLVEALEQRHDFVSGDGVEGAGGFVGQQQRRMVDQGAGDGDALALASGELAGLVIHARLEVDGAQGGLGVLFAVLAIHAGVDERQLDVVQRAGAGQQVEGLEHEADFLVADAGELVVVHFADQVAVEVVQAGGGRIQAADQVHQRGLAGAGGAHDGDVLALLDFDVDAGDGVDFLIAHDVGLAQVPGADERRRRA